MSRYRYHRVLHKIATALVRFADAVSTKVDDAAYVMADVAKSKNEDAHHEGRRVATLRLDKARYHADAAAAALKAEAEAYKAEIKRLKAVH